MEFQVYVWFKFFNDHSCLYIHLVGHDNDVLRALGRKECVFLVLLDLSAAFDPVDHYHLKTHLEQEFVVSDSASQWLE